MLSEIEYYLLVQKSALHPNTVSSIEYAYLGVDKQRWLEMMYAQWQELQAEREYNMIKWQNEPQTGLSRSFLKALDEDHVDWLEKTSTKMRRYEIAIERQERELSVLKDAEQSNLAPLYRRAIQRHRDKLEGMGTRRIEDVELWNVLEGAWG